MDEAGLRMDDLSGLQISAGAFGVVSVSALLMVLVQRVKDYLPALSGRGAMVAVDAISLLVAVIVMLQLGSDWRDPATYIALFMGTLALGIITRGHYASMFFVKVEGLPPSSSAEVSRSAIRDDATERTDEFRPVVRRQ